MIMAEVSAYPRELDYGRFRDIADASGAFCEMNMAHISELGAAGVTYSRFESAEIAASSRHKWLSVVWYVN